MQKRNLIIDNLRGLCMLGVIAIHTASSITALSDSALLVYLLFEVLSRYSVPAFFFISGFGLLSAYRLDKPLHYRSYLLKRLQSVGLPYIVWSLLYIAYYEHYYPGNADLSPSGLFHTLFFGLAVYHIYFLVILIWFYVMFPLWRFLLRLMHRFSLLLSMLLLFFLQLAFNYWTSNFWSYPAQFANYPFLLDLLNYRLNYLPLHYLFVFICGALAAVHYQAFSRLLQKYFNRIALFFVLTVALLCTRFFYLLEVRRYTLEAIANTLHQLSSEGLLYTLASLLFFSALLQKTDKAASFFLRINNLFSSHSFLIYLIHPVFLHQLAFRWPFIFDPKGSLDGLLTYCSVLVLSLVSSLLFTKLFAFLPFLSLLLTGRRK